MTGNTLVELYASGGAILGIWALIRFPSRAPSTVHGAMFALLAAVGATAAVPTILGYCVDHGGKWGGLAGLVGLVLPTMTAIFWAAGSLYRVFSGLFSPGAR